jgi:hypothetical protein
MFRLVGVVGVVVLAAIYGVAYDVTAVVSGITGHPWDPYGSTQTPIPTARPTPRVVAQHHWAGGYVIKLPPGAGGPADLTMGRPFTLQRAAVMLKFSAFSYELKYMGVSDLRNGAGGSKIVTMHYHCTDAAYDHAREYTGTVSYVRAEIEGGWLQSNLMPLRTACR